MSISYKLFMVFLICVSLVAGFLLTPRTTIKYDPGYVTGVDYGFEEGDFILVKQRVKVSRVFSMSGLSFLQEPDGTIHLYTRKSAAKTLHTIQKNQMSRLYFARVLLFKANRYSHRFIDQLISMIRSERVAEQAGKVAGETR